MQAFLTEYGQAKSGFGALANYSTVLCVLVFIQVGFYLPLTSGQTYLPLTIPWQTFSFSGSLDPELLIYYQ